MKRSEILSILKKKISTYRFEHSLRVEKTAIKIAQNYKLSNVVQEKISLACLCHDILKESTPKLLKEENIEQTDEYTNLYKQYPAVWHALAAPDYLIKKLKIIDKDILDAVKYHCTGNQNLNIIAKIVYLADYVEPGRTHKNIKKLRNLCEKNLNIAMYTVTYETYNYLETKNYQIHPYTTLCLNWYRKYV